MVNVVVVEAGAAKAAETVVAIIITTKKAFAQYLPIKERIEKQGELWDMVVMGSLLARYYGPNFSTHGNLGQNGTPIARKLHRLTHLLALISQITGYLEKNALILLQNS
jgi:hypothetical protein